MTETVTHIAVRALSKKALALHGNDSPETTHSSEIPFTALPGIKLSVDAGGCLIIDAPGITRGPVVTNDLADLISDKQFHWLGRKDTVINSGGVKIIPEQLEDKLRKHIASPFFVAGIPDKLLGERVVLVVEGSGQKDILQKRLSSLVTLQKFELPKAIYFADTFLKTGTNKIRRKETLAMVVGRSG
jgi:O-succinylbenzoic acid--CoA ligase